MPPRWSRKPTRQDPDYRRLDDRMNFAVHVALFSACNSGLWFVSELRHTSYDWAKWFTGLWAIVLILHAIYIFAIADYNPNQTHG